MSTFIIEIHPKKAAFDPLAKAVKAELLEAGQPQDESQVSTQRLFRVEGDVTPEQIQNAADVLLVDPVVETVIITETDSKTKKKAAVKKGAGFPTIDVWPKAGVTDSIGETVEKGLRDLGLSRDIRAHAGVRYVFPKIKNDSVLKKLAQQNLANEMIHDIIISRSN